MAIVAGVVAVAVTGKPFPEVPVIGTIQRDKLAVSHDVGSTADLEPAHDVAWAVLLTMLLVAMTGVVRGNETQKEGRPSGT